MLIILGILLMFTKLTSGLLIKDPVVCTFIGMDQCYVAEGQRLHLSIPREKKFNLKLTQGPHVFDILRYTRNAPIILNPVLPTGQFVTDNMTLIVNSAEKNISGNYSLETFDSGGKFKGRYFLQLNIEARVSSVEISQNCLTPGVMKVSCSANGDNLSFKLTGDYNNPLGNQSHTVELDRNYQGNVTCHVENHVSRGHTSRQLRPCPEPSTRTTTVITSGSPSKQSPGTNSTVSHKETNSFNQTLTTSQPSSFINTWFLNLGLIVMISVCVLLIIISVVALYIYRRTHRAKNKGAISQGGRELEYAQVNHFRDGHTEPKSRTPRAQVEDVEYAEVNSRASSKKQKTCEDEVQYGELVFNSPAKNRRQTPIGQEDCIYSQVHHS